MVKSTSPTGCIGWFNNYTRCSRSWETPGKLWTETKANDYDKLKCWRSFNFKEIGQHMYTLTIIKSCWSQTSWCYFICDKTINIWTYIWHHDTPGALMWLDVASTSDAQLSCISWYQTIPTTITIISALVYYWCFYVHCRLCWHRSTVFQCSCSSLVRRSSVTSVVHRM